MAIGLLLVMLIAMTAAACNKKTEEEQVFGKGLNVSFLKDFTIDLDGVTSLAIEKRATVKTATARNVAYADEVSEKNKLVGETADKTVVEITLRTKMGETFSQDNLQAEFNKLYVSGNFVYFELIPLDFYERASEDGVYSYYLPEDYDENGQLKENVRPKVVRIYARDLVGKTVDFDRVSSHYMNMNMYHGGVENGSMEMGDIRDVVGAFVYSIESDKIYDLSETGYEVMGKDVVKIGGNVCRVNINDNGEYETSALFNDYTASKIAEYRVDRWGNVFGKSTDSLSYVDTETRVFVESTQASNNIRYAIDENGKSVQLNNEDGEVKWITENGELRDPQLGDYFVQKKIYINGYYWEGIIDGEALYYCQGLDMPTPNMAIPREFNATFYGIRFSATIMIDFATQKNGAIADENGNFPTDDDAIYAVWYDLSDPNATIGVADETVVGLNVITDNFYEKYPNPQQNPYGDNPDAFVVSNQDGETTYEFYWDDAEQTVKIRVQEEIIAPPKEVKKFQPIGG